VPELGELEDIDKNMLKFIEDHPKKFSDLIERYKIKDAVFEMMSLAREGNKYFNDSEPWKSVKTDKAKCATTLNICLQTIYTLAEMFSPVIPFTSEKIFAMLNKEKTSWFESGKANLKAGHQLNKPQILFTKIEDKVIDEQINKLGVPEGEEIEPDEEITIDDFMKVKLKVAKVLEAENIPKSKKLVKLQIEIGNEKRQLVAGIAECYKPEELIGKKIVVVANLKKAKLFGVESQGMLLAANDGAGLIKVIEVDDTVETGTQIK